MAMVTIASILSKFALASGQTKDYPQENKGRDFKQSGVLLAGLARSDR